MNEPDGPLYTLYTESTINCLLSDITAPPLTTIAIGDLDRERWSAISR